MMDSILQNYGAKLKVMQAHAQSLNIFLEMELAALRGNEELSQSIKYVAERLPTSYAGNAEGDRVQSFLIAQTFVSLISEFEAFLVDVMSVVIRKYPNKLGAETFRLSEILELRDPDEITRVAAERFVNSIMYKRASEYRKALADLLSAEANFLEDKWPDYVERKARRDLGVHNGWRTNDTYRRKLIEVGMNPESAEFVTPTNDYFWDTLTLLSDLADRITQHCGKKFS